MRSLKLLFMQASFISTGIFLGVGIAQIIYHLIGDEYISEWYFIPSVLLTGILCSLPVLLIAGENQSHYKLRIVAHFSILFIAVSLLGLLFKWYSNFMGYAIVMLIFICVYVFVWIVTAWIYKEEDKQINTALDCIRDEE